MKNKAKKFIKACNVMDIVQAKEGGVIFLENLLVDFVKFIKEDKTVDAEVYFTANEPHDPTFIIVGQRVSKDRCIDLMNKFAQLQHTKKSKVVNVEEWWDTHWHLYDPDGDIYTIQMLKILNEFAQSQTETDESKY